MRNVVVAAVVVVVDDVHDGGWGVGMDGLYITIVIHKSNLFPPLRLIGMESSCIYLHLLHDLFTIYL